MNICSAGNLFVSCNDKIVEEKLMCQSVKPLCLMASGCSDRNKILQNSWLNFGNWAICNIWVLALEYAMQHFQISVAVFNMVLSFA